MHPLSWKLRGAGADQYFLYSFLYTVAVVLLGVRFFYRYRHNRYQMWRNSSVIFFQLILAFLVPSFLRLMGQREFYFTYFWPLAYNSLFPSSITGLLKDPHATVGYHSYELDKLRESFGEFGIVDAPHANRPVPVRDSIDDILRVVREL